jgi:hypothetical protein
MVQQEGTTVKITGGISGLLAVTLCCLLIGCGTNGDSSRREAERNNTVAVVAAYAEWPGALQNLCTLTESLRTFGGRFKDAPVWVYVPAGLQQMLDDNQELITKLASVGAEVRTCQVPQSAVWFYYGGKPSAAAAAEAAAVARKARLLIWMDDDTVILSDLDELDLAPPISLAYCPVMHNRSGTLYGTEPNPFWGRIYEKLALTDEMLFPMVTPADEQRIRAYFHCGLMSVRPEVGILRRWAQDFELLTRDSVLLEMCQTDQTYRVFLHQAALTGSVLHTIGRAQMVPLSDRYNYPIFFEKQYGATRPFDSIDRAVTIRRVVRDEYLDDDWLTGLSGPPDRIAWLKEHLN